MTENDIALAKATLDPFALMESLDDKAIIAEIEGQVIGKWVYHFPQKGNEIWGLSKVGVDEACREMAKRGEAIREGDVNWTPDPTSKEHVLFKAMASRIVFRKNGQEVELDKAFGTKRQWTKMKLKSGETQYDQFWFEKGSIKALRNARQRLISEEVRSTIIASAKKGGKVEQVSAEPPKPKQTEENQYKVYLKRCKVARKTLGDEKYYAVLNSYQYEHSNDIKKFSEFEKVLAELTKAKEKK